MAIICGIDIGATGAIAHVCARAADLEDLVVIGGVIDAQWLADYIALLGEEVTYYIEKLQAMPKTSKSVCFKMGQNYGIVRGALAAAGVRFVEVAPGVWKKAMGLTKDKDRSRSEAMRIFPDLHEELKRKKDHDRAEALLLAEYGRREQHRLGLTEDGQ